MTEIIITLIIAVVAAYILVKSIFNYKNGKCNCGCDKCISKNKCVKKNED